VFKSVTNENNKKPVQPKVVPSISPELLLGYEDACLSDFFPKGLKIINFK
jgi:hypothetical protein